MKLIVYTDGASRGNPGKAAIGVVIYNEKGELIDTISEYIGEATNNVAEYTALIRALEYGREKGYQEIQIFSDSELMVKQINGQYKVRNEGLKPLFNLVKNLINRYKKVEVIHVRREKNKEADRLANEALDNIE